MDWQTATRSILQRLDLRAEYAAFGVEIASDNPSATGWLSCRVFGSDDRSPSAGVNVAGDGPALGRYKEFAGEARNLSLFEFASTAAGKFADWKAARKHYAKAAGVKLPRGNEPEKPADRLVFRAGREHQIAAWCQTKPPITLDAALAAGARVAGWPASTQQYTVIALPIYGPALTDAGPTGWMIWNKTGRLLPLYQGQGREPTYKKMLMIGGSKSGWMGRWSLDHLAGAEVVWKTEGPGDMLAVMSILPEALRGRHVAIANSGGTQEGLFPDFWRHLAGKVVYVIHDCDKDGQAGGLKQARLAAGVAVEVRHLILPYPIVEKHGKDVRDWVNEQLSQEPTP